MKFTHLFFLAAIFLIGSGFNKGDAVVDKGNVVYSFASGTMQCLSEVDPEGQVVILLKGLDKNTKALFRKIDCLNSKKPILEVNMVVVEETNLCAGWTNMQAVHIAIDPKPVKQITLTGTTVYKTGNVTILSTEFEGL